MSDVKKWYIGSFGGEAQARPCSPAEFEIIHASEGRLFVLAENYDSAVQCFLTAAEGCVAAERRERALQQRLTAADERADVLEGHYFELKEAARQLIDNAVDDEGAGEMVVQRADIDELRPLIAALKPAEGGGDESAHDRAYRNGLMQGYNLALNGSEKEYQDAVAIYPGGKDAE